MTDVIIAARKPKLVRLEEGKKYFWCRCGRSARQPFCDGSHRETDLEPLAFVAERSDEYLLCVCKQTHRGPWCDGSHNNLDDAYEEASEAEIAASKHFPTTRREGGITGKAVLDGNCYVNTVNPRALQRNRNIAWSSMISRSDGARCLELYYLEADRGEPAVVAFPGSNAAIFVLDGEGTIIISSKQFEIQPEQGLFIESHEAFSIRPNDGTNEIKLTITLCPQSGGPTWLDEMPNNFESRVTERVFAVDSAKRELMADRFYQVLIDDRIGSANMTQFVGEIPRSRAAGHHHLYEETITILSGSGYLWTEGARAEVQPGDVIFLPRRQLHSLECTSENGMRLVGVFFPAGSPAINY